MKTTIGLIFIASSFLSINANAAANYDCTFQKLDGKSHYLIKMVATTTVTPPMNSDQPDMGSMFGKDGSVEARVGTYFVSRPSEDSLGLFGQRKLWVSIHSDEVSLEFGVSLDRTEYPVVAVHTFSEGYLYRVECRLGR